MDVYTPSGTPVQADSHLRLLYLTLAFGALAALIVGLCWFNQRSHVSENEGQLAFSLGRGGALHTISAGTYMKATITDTSGTVFDVTGSARGEAGTVYYLLAKTDDPTSSNLYRRTQDGTLTQLTTSVTSKYGLTYDAQSHTAAYGLVSGDVVLVRDDSSNEVTVGKGEQSAILPGGRRLLVEQEGKLAILEADSGKATELLSLANGARVAFNIGTKSVYLYNPVTKALDHYALKNDNTISYVSSSHPLAIVPNALGISAGDPIVAYLGANGDRPAYSFLNIARMKTTTVAVPAGTPASLPNVITTLYE